MTSQAVSPDALSLLEGAAKMGRKRGFISVVDMEWDPEAPGYVYVLQCSCSPVRFTASEKKRYAYCPKCHAGFDVWRGRQLTKEE